MNKVVAFYLYTILLQAEIPTMKIEKPMLLVLFEKTTESMIVLSVDK